MWRPICRIAAMLVLMVATVAAQTNATNWNTVKALTAGTDVRVTAGSRTVRGTIDRVTDDTLVLASGKGQEMFTQVEITRVWVGKKSHRRRNALIGLGVGAAAGLAVGLTAASCTGLGCIGARDVEIGAPVGFAIIGTAIGAVIPTGGWREIYKK